MFAQAPSKWGMWEKWGEQPDGMYQNPVLPADFSDLDCIRVGKDYYAITSTFQYSPGMAVVHSKDLVNWNIIGHAVEDIRQIGPEMNWDRMNRYGRGIWAGSIRYNDGKFYVLFGTPEEGFFTTWAEKPEGPWAPLTNILPEGGWDDCSAIWDENGQAYFIGTHFKGGYRTYIFKMAPDCSSIDRNSAVLVNEGDRREASKLIKVKDWYYLIYSKVEDGIRFVMGKRAKNISGTWSEEKQLMAYNQESNEPNQGGIIEGPDGNWYFFTHHGRGDWEGRIASLLPVTWINDWPIMGKVGDDGLGYMIWSGKMPLNKKYKKKKPFFDDFKSKKLDANWEWNYYPRNEMWSLSEKKGHLRMRAVKPVENNNLRKTPNILTQRIYRTSHSEVTLKMNVQGMEDGQVAGLCHFARASAYIGISETNGSMNIVFSGNGKSENIEIGRTKNIWFRSVWGLDGINKFSYSTDGKTFIELGTPFQFTWNDYRGTRVGMFTYNEKNENGYVDVDYFEYKK
ncbi:beta-xylosidase [Dysgonomonas sp. 216]|nr:beta-xylosidase [Dysgonomonas sp. 216]